VHDDDPAAPARASKSRDLHDFTFGNCCADGVEDEIKAAEAGSGGVEQLGYRYLVGSCALACHGLTAATLYV
jgi:hypothetical protein